MLKQMVSIYKDGFMESFSESFGINHFYNSNSKISRHLKSLNAWMYFYSTSNYLLWKKNYLLDGFTQSKSLIFHFRYSIRLQSPLTIKSWFGMTGSSHPDTVFNQQLLKVDKWVVLLFQPIVNSSETSTLFTMEMLVRKELC